MLGFGPLAGAPLAATGAVQNVAIYGPFAAALALTGATPGYLNTTGVIYAPSPAVLALTGTTPKAYGPSYASPAPAALTVTGSVTLVNNSTFALPPASLSLSGRAPFLGAWLGSQPLADTWSPVSAASGVWTPVPPPSV